MNKLDLSKKLIIGMVHCLPFPGTVKYEDDMKKIASQAIQDAITLEKAGVDAVIVENMGDDPFNEVLDNAQIVALASVSTLVAQKINIPIGIDAAMNDYETALSVAKVIDADFVRIPVFVDTVEYYGGIIEPCAREALLHRKKINAENVKIFADIQVKHTHMLLPTVSIEDSAKAAIDCGADAIIVTGTHIGKETPIEIIKRVKAMSSIPVLAGSGVKKENIREQLEIADGAIVGSSLKIDGIITNPVSYELTKELIDNFRSFQE
ncbi:BtpA/SgcQ family protein [Tepidanaerobacter syntrophicus]|uniref:BtpA/SgcQ family protein n=1 Tax=Tepidanaerobacter syntrophicus TaxID=224999 RepID=UPI001BD239DC|nr:BtpA/SgcQ family protein [Tepidanaerobacter syntrophicus]